MTTAIHRTKWFIPGVSVALGLVIFAALWIYFRSQGGYRAVAITEGATAQADKVA